MLPRSSYAQYQVHKRRQFGAQFSTTDLAPQFVPYFESGARIEVRSPSGWTRRGRVGITTGWRPAFLLMSRTNCRGSSDVLGAGETVVRVVAK